jgi:hypothetical protein
MSAQKDGWTKVDVKRLARKVLGKNARAWAVGHRRYVGVETHGGRRLVLAAASTWAELARVAFVLPLEAAEKAKAAGFDVKGIRQAVIEAYSGAPSTDGDATEDPARNDAST